MSHSPFSPRPDKFHNTLYLPTALHKDGAMGQPGRTQANGGPL